MFLLLYEFFLPLSTGLVGSNTSRAMVVLCLHSFTLPLLFRKYKGCHVRQGSPKVIFTRIIIVSQTNSVLE